MFGLLVYDLFVTYSCLCFICYLSVFHLLLVYVLFVTCLCFVCYLYMHFHMLLVHVLNTTAAFLDHRHHHIATATIATYVYIQLL